MATSFQKKTSVAGLNFDDEARAHRRRERARVRDFSSEERALFDRPFITLFARDGHVVETGARVAPGPPPRASGRAASSARYGAVSSRSGRGATRSSGGGYGGGAPRPTTHRRLAAAREAAGARSTRRVYPLICCLPEPRPPLSMPPRAAEEDPGVDGIAALVGEFEDPKRGDEKPAETSARPRRLEPGRAFGTHREEKKQRHAAKLRAQSETYDPKTDVNIPKDTDPYKTLFVGRLAYDADEDALRREFETFGDVRTVTIPVVRNARKNADDENETTRHCGYAFVEYAREDDMKAAHRGANGRTIEGAASRDERGRAAPGWRPRRLGGGVGRGRLSRPKKGANQGSKIFRHRKTTGSGGTATIGARTTERTGAGARRRPVATVRHRRDEMSGRPTASTATTASVRIRPGGSDRDWDRTGD